MSTKHGKTARLLNRLPHFYQGGELEKDFMQLYETLGGSLERMEHLLFAVLQAHHVSTATNIGSKGYTAQPTDHGDLDKLFSLYLEALGGTSQLVKMNPRFTRKSFYLEKLLSSLYQPAEALTDRLRLLLWETEQAAPEAVDPVRAYLPATIAYTQDEIGPPLVLGLLLRQDTLMRYLADRLDAPAQELLGTYDGKGPVPQPLALALQEFLNGRILKDPYLYPKNMEEVWEELPMDQVTRQRCDALHRDFLKHYYERRFAEDASYFDHDQRNLHRRLEELRFAEPPASPAQHDLLRLNRTLLDTYVQFHPVASGAKPWGIRQRQIPDAKTVSLKLRDRFNALLSDQTERVRSFFDDILATTPVHMELEKHYADQTVMLRRQLLEQLLPYEIEHLYRGYQKRMQAIMQVLRKGASTRQGIQDIVAANFGLIGNDPEVLKTKELFQIDEFDPEETHFGKQEVALSEPFAIYNPNQDAVLPRVRVTLLPAQIKSVRNLRFINEASGQVFTVPLTLQVGDSFTVEQDEVFFNGVLSSAMLDGSLHSLPAMREVFWRVEAEILSNNLGSFGKYGRYDQTEVEEAIFIAPIERVLEVEVLSYKLTYGAFSINIPWHIDGVTDKFAETEDHPRHQIRSLVDKVKAAGVRVNVAYKQVFAEDHELADRFDLELSGTMLQERHDQEDRFSIDSRLGVQEQHELKDSLKLSATFDYTEFNSGNTFG